MRTDWVDFASTGNPGWASYDPNTRSTRVYTAEPTTQFWNSMISRRRRSGSMRLGDPPSTTLGERTRAALPAADS
jgi:hypothetical protein